MLYEILSNGYLCSNNTQIHINYISYKIKQFFSLIVQWRVAIYIFSNKLSFLINVQTMNLRNRWRIIEQNKFIQSVFQTCKGR